MQSHFEVALVSTLKIAGPQQFSLQISVGAFQHHFCDRKQGKPPDCAAVAVAGHLEPSGGTIQLCHRMNTNSAHL